MTPLTYIGCALIVLVYFLPTIVAFRREADGRWFVLFCNTFAGLTAFGYVIAFYAALTQPSERISTRRRRRDEDGRRIAAAEQPYVDVRYEPFYGSVHHFSRADRILTQR